MSPATLPSLDAVTQHQLAILESVLSTLGPFLLGHHRPFETESPQVDGGAVAAASATFSKTCDRIEAILEDGKRWNTEIHDRLYASIERVQAAQETFLREQAESAKAVRRPSFQLQPKIANDGTQFIAFFGDINRAGYAIIGVGRTPAAALLDFDAAFERAPQEQIILAAETQDISIEQPKPEPKKRKKE